MKDKTVAGILAIFLGWLGIHHFYLGNKSKGLAFLIIQIVCCFVTFFGSFLGVVGLILILPSYGISILLVIIGIIEGIILLCKDQDEFDSKYNQGRSYVVRTQGQFMSAQSRATTSQSSTQAPPKQEKSKTEQLMELKSLLDNGVLTQEEFDSEKQRILHRTSQ